MDPLCVFGPQPEEYCRTYERILASELQVTVDHGYLTEELVAIYGDCCKQASWYPFRMFPPSILDNLPKPLPEVPYATTHEHVRAAVWHNSPRMARFFDEATQSMRVLEYSGHCERLQGLTTGEFHDLADALDRTARHMVYSVVGTCAQTAFARYNSAHVRPRKPANLERFLEVIQRPT